MTGGVMEKLKDSNGFRLLEHQELVELFHDYNNLLNAGFTENLQRYSMSYPYQEGDCIFIDNLAIAHRASEQAHMDPSQQGLRILHRTTIKPPQPFLPPFGLPGTITRDILQAANRSGDGVFVAGGLGFRWDENIRMQN
jgi:taurine dioxygenase